MPSLNKAALREEFDTLKGDFERLCAEEDLDLVYTATPWEWHVPVLLSAMENGKHAATEVPACYTLDDCWAMVETAERLRSLGYVTGILSDQTDWLDRLDSRDHFYQYFDRVYNSYYLGKGKRDPSHFGDVASDLDLDPTAVLFIDDSKNNVTTAIAAGMQDIQYIDPESFIKALKDALGIELI